jgi:hypothetical protein
MEPKGLDIIVLMNTSPVFKGVSVTIIGSLALLYSFWLIKKWKEPLSWQFKIFIGLSLFITLYGLYILIFQPQWWIPPWWPNTK